MRTAVSMFISEQSWFWIWHILQSHIFGTEVESIALRPCLCCDLVLIQAASRIYRYWIISLELNIEQGADLASLYRLQRVTACWKQSQRKRRMYPKNYSTEQDY
jgi:hypothetical protein